MKLRPHIVPVDDVQYEEMRSAPESFVQSMISAGFRVLTSCLLMAFSLGLLCTSSALGESTTQREPASSGNQSAVPTKGLKGAEPAEPVDARKRAHRAIVLGRIGKPSDIDRLVQWLNDTRTVRIGNSVRVTSVNKVSQRSLHRILKRTIINEPSNIRVLTPLLQAATDGTPDQRRAAVEILGSLKEPLAEPLLSRLAADPKGPFSEIAATGLNRIRSDHVFSHESLRMKYFQIFLLVACVIIGIGVFFAMVREQRGGDWARALLLALCLVITLWFSGIIGSDYVMTLVKDASINKAIRQNNLLALSKKITFDLSDYPADSYVARYLASKGDPSIVPILAQVKKEIPSSTLYQGYWNKSLQQRIDWIISRIKASAGSKADTGSHGSKRQFRAASPEEIFSEFPIPTTV